jgi:hypothetical protein
MTRDVIEGSRNKTFAEQQALLAELGKNRYEAPPSLDATTCMFLEYVRSKGRTRLYGVEPITYTRCQDSFDERLLMVGSFTPQGFCVEFNTSNDYDSIGIAGYRKLV